MRLFIGVEIGKPAAGELENALLKLKKTATGNFVPPANLHMTLQFLGEKPPSDVPLISQAMHAAAAGYPALRFYLKEPGRFPRGSESIFWYGIGGDTEKLRQLAEDVQRQLDAKGVSFEKEKFKPHITLGRRVKTQADIQEALEAVRVKPAEFRVSDIVLFESTRINSVLTYIPVAREKLGGPA